MDTNAPPSTDYQERENDQIRSPPRKTAFSEADGDITHDRTPSTTAFSYSKHHAAPYMKKWGTAILFILVFVVFVVVYVFYHHKHNKKTKNEHSSSSTSTKNTETAEDNNTANANYSTTVHRGRNTHTDTQDYEIRLPKDSTTNVTEKSNSFPPPTETLVKDSSEVPGEPINQSHTTTETRINYPFENVDQDFVKSRILEATQFTHPFVLFIWDEECGACHAWKEAVAMTAKQFQSQHPQSRVKFYAHCFQDEGYQPLGDENDVYDDAGYLVESAKTSAFKEELQELTDHRSIMTPCLLAYDTKHREDKGDLGLFRSNEEGIATQSNDDHDDQDYANRAMKKVTQHYFDVGESGADELLAFYQQLDSHEQEQKQAEKENENEEDKEENE
jgi:Ca2+/Na+ antiporter